ncbi:MAG: type II toxin-antitoxin system RatA family toxin [Gammaproteobacteria bacterium]
MIDKVSGTLPYSCEQIFDLAADIERYPEFLQGWISARIQRRESDTCYVDQVLGFGPVHLEFASKAVLHRPERIDVSSTDPPFRQYSLSWRIEPVPGGCRISITADFQMRSMLSQLAVNQALPAAVDRIIAAFEARAHALYGGR